LTVRVTRLFALPGQRCPFLDHFENVFKAQNNRKNLSLFLTNSFKGDTMQIPQEFFSSNSVLTFTGATAAIFVVSNTIRVLTGRSILLVNFLIALIVAYLGAYISHALVDVVNWFLTALNGCLLFCATAGVQEVGKVAMERPPAGPQKSVRFLSSWFS
jgi:hypothetical protein